MHDVLCSIKAGFFCYDCLAPLPFESIQIYKKQLYKENHNVRAKEDLLETARDYGIRYLLFKTRASSKATPRKSSKFTAIYDFRELML